MTIEIGAEVSDLVRCNNCMTVHHEDIETCPTCQTDEYLMQQFVYHGTEKGGIGVDL